MSEAAALKALSKETKALIIVSEFEARRMPLFQMRAVLNAIVSNEEEKKVIVDLVERDLRATGYPADEIATFLNDLIHLATVAKPSEIGQPQQGTRRLRSPFALGFEAGAGAEQDKTFPKTAVYTMKHGPTAEASEPPLAKPPPPPMPAPQLPTPPGGVPMRRKTFVFDDKGLPASVESSPPAARVPPRPAPPPPPPPPPAAPMPPPGTKAWREQMFFGKANAGLAPASGMPDARPLVLVADDDKRIRMVFRIRIEEAGLSVVECENGHDAWERLQKGDVALAVLDMKMPGLHGLEILSNMQNKQMQIPIVICSAYDQLQDEFIVKSYPRLRYLVKPVAPETLIAAIKELLALKTQA